MIFRQWYIPNNIYYIERLKGDGTGMLAVSGDFSREVLDATGTAALAQNVTVQGIAASSLTLRGKKKSTFLTHIAVHMKTAIQCDNPHGLLLSRLRHYRVPTYRTAGGKLPVEVINTVDLRGGIHGKRHSIQATSTYYACEAARVVSLSHCS